MTSAAVGVLLLLLSAACLLQPLCSLSPADVQLRVLPLPSLNDVGQVLEGAAVVLEPELAQRQVVQQLRLRAEA
jgi:hypothetical protein